MKLRETSRQKAFGEKHEQEAKRFRQLRGKCKPQGKKDTPFTLCSSKTFARNTDKILIHLFAFPASLLKRRRMKTILKALKN